MSSLSRTLFLHLPVLTLSQLDYYLYASPTSTPIRFLIRTPLIANKEDKCSFSHRKLGCNEGFIFYLKLSYTSIWWKLSHLLVKMPKNTLWNTRMSTLHRVLANGQERYSIPYFVEPSHDYVVECLPT
ncbi:unnamed protein product [Lactuca virosa]|uniref:Isopenicillin N synthase-like Fe(2+) 2OG dioxygenase domain-containing protein n=1 Tax=Lactuca virosa TaxID=75947 RepID=A0AAU9M8T8_9ASTR|nr:unnamed protein product [Lactuca virosa]